MSDDQSQWGTGWGEGSQDQPSPPPEQGGSWGQQPPGPPPGQPQQPPPPQQQPGPPPQQGGWGQQPPPQQPPPQQPPPQQPPPQQGGWGQQPPQPGTGQPASPGGGYGQPAPPPGGYGQAPPPGAPPQWGQQPGQGAYGQPTGPTTGPYTIGNAFSYGWAKFQANAGQIILGFVALIVIGFVINFVGSLITGGLSGAILDPNDPSGAGIFVVLVATAISSIFSFVVQVLIQAGITRGALSITYGRQFEINQLFTADQLPQILLASLLVGVMTAVGFILLIIPGLIVMFCTQYVVHFIIDKRLSPVDAIKASFKFTSDNVGTLIGFFLASLAAIFAGFLACLIGSLVAIPVVIIAQAFTYRSLQGEPVAP